MKKKAALFSLTILLLFLATGLTACNERNRIFRYGYWEYIVVGKESRIPKNKNDSVIAVVGLTESGAEQLALDVPSAINGTEVAYLGFEKYDIAINYYTLTSRNLLRLYIPENILSIKPYVFESLSAPDAKTIYNGAAEPSVHFSSSPEFYVYRELYEKIKSKHADCLDEEGSTDCPSCPWILETFVPANVAFMNNYSAAVNRGYFRAEDVESGEKIPEPPAPEREGYVFTGWYTEAEAINLWDFDTKTEIPDGEELRLYAGWKKL